MAYGDGSIYDSISHLIIHCFLKDLIFQFLDVADGGLNEWKCGERVD